MAMLNNLMVMNQLIWAKNSAPAAKRAKFTGGAGLIIVLALFVFGVGLVVAWQMPRFCGERDLTIRNGDSNQKRWRYSRYTIIQCYTMLYNVIQCYTGIPCYTELYRGYTTYIYNYKYTDWLNWDYCKFSWSTTGILPWTNSYATEPVSNTCVFWGQVGPGGRMRNSLLLWSDGPVLMETTEITEFFSHSKSHDVGW